MINATIGGVEDGIAAGIVVALCQQLYANNKVNTKNSGTVVSLPHPPGRIPAKHGISRYSEY